ncbi:hypothetical protein [Halopiger goleimassiliensis]|uniref:hypothetical protein n=1 Tax=Halopiger goleimassiliensis TaxID=1293048 RepID=UPI000677768C|nr:hypothetical protein [Halopiger goleimassiliensis]
MNREDYFVFAVLAATLLLSAIGVVTLYPVTSVADAAFVVAVFGFSGLAVGLLFVSAVWPERFYRLRRVFGG